MAIAKEAAKQAGLLDRLGAAAKGRRLGGPAGVLFAVVHLFFELLGLFFVDEAEAGQAVFQLKGVEKGAVLVVGPRIVYFLIPDDASSGGLEQGPGQQMEPGFRGGRGEGGWSTNRNVDHFQPVRVADEIVGQDDGALETGVGPFGAVGVGNEETGDGDGLNLVGLLGNEALDRVLVIVVEDRRHGGGEGGEGEGMRRGGGLWKPRPPAVRQAEADGSGGEGARRRGGGKEAVGSRSRMAIQDGLFCFV